MKPMTSALMICAAVVVLVGLGFSSEGNAQGGQRWEYAYLAKRFSTVTITRVIGDRCSTEVVVTPEAARFGVGADGQLNRAATAMTKLTDEGWEMVTEGVAYCDQTDENIQAIHFRRPR